MLNQVSARKTRGVLALAILLGTALSLYGQSDQPPAIVGAWVVTAPQGNRPQVTPVVISAEGTMVALISFMQDRQGNAQGSAAGVWKQTADREFSFTLVSAFTNNNQGDIGMLKIRGVAKLDDTGDAFTTEVKLDLVDLDGKMIASDSSVLNGKRIKVEPL